MTNVRKNSKENPFNFFLPIAIILSIVPLIVRISIVKLDEYTQELWGVAEKTDLFSQKKALLLLIFSIILIIISVIYFKKIFSKKDKITNIILIGCGVFTLFTLLSAIFSKYQHVAFWGIFDRAEGFITIACYMILFIYTIYSFKTTEDYKYIITPILILVFINAFLGLFQYVGQDLIKTSLGAAIIGSDSASGINLLNEKGTIYGTLYSYNYMGSFVSMVFPILFFYTFIEDDVMYKIMCFIGTLLSFWLLIGSSARSGIIGVLGAFVLAVIIFWKIIVKKWKAILIGLGVLIVLVIGANFATHGKIFNRIPTMAQDTLNLFKDTSSFDYTTQTPIKDIKYDGKTTVVEFQNDTLKISYENGNPVFKDSKDEIVNYTLNNKVLTTDNENFKNITFAFGKLDKNSIISDSLLLRINDVSTFLFKLDDNKIFHLMDMSTKQFVTMENPKVAKYFIGKESIGSARGYIWGRSVPLIKDTILLGTGPDTFVFDFPQGDLIGKYYAYNTPNIVVDKVHNLYLQIAINYGVIALIGFLIMVVLYLGYSIKLYAFKEKNDFEDKSLILGAITSLAILGYLVAGMFNDSNVGTAPIFWIIFGVGVAINYLNGKQLKKSSK